MDAVEAIAIDGVVDNCSVDNSEWRRLAGMGVMKRVSTCATNTCDQTMGGERVGRKCVQMTLPLGSVYDVLVSSALDTPYTLPRALRVRAPWVHTDGRCLVTEGPYTVCGGTDITWHGGVISMGGPEHMSSGIGVPMTRLNATIGSAGVSFVANKARPSTDVADLIYLSLDRGMRITRIVTASTVDKGVVEKLRVATSRDELLKICVWDHGDSCIISEHMHHPTTAHESHPGWSFEQQRGSSVRASSGVPGSVLWVADVPQDECHVTVGSWLLGSIPLTDDTKTAALFSQSISQACDTPQAVVLIRPGFAWPTLVRRNNRAEWSLTFFEVQAVDELGVPVRRI
jgi:hypothetical protein